MLVEMTDEIKFKRIERIIKDLEYELASGLHQNLLDECIHAELFIGYVSKEYPAWRLRISFEPVSEYDLMMISPEKRYEGLRLVKG